MKPAFVLGALSCWLLAACDGAPAPTQPAGEHAAVEPASAARRDALPGGRASVPGALPQQAVLDRYLEAALQRVPAPDCLARDQREWHDRTRADCGSDAACLDTARARRAALLEGLLPGAVLDARLDARAPAVEAQLLTVVGGEGDPATVEPLPLEPVSLEGRPRETEGGYLLAGEDFDAEAYEAFEALLGDEEGLRARFGDGPIVFAGLSGALPAQLLDVGDLAAVEAVAARGGRLRVNGWAVPDPDGVPTIDGAGCVFVYALGEAVPR